MTNSEMVRLYIERNGYRYTKKPGEESLAPLMPYFIMDIGYQYYCKDILTMKVRHQLKQQKERWSESYLTFNDTFVNTYTNDELIEVGDLIDQLHQYIGNYLTIAQVSGMKVFEKEFDFNQQKILSSILMTNKLAVIAQHTWRAMWKRDNHDINGVMEWSLGFSDWYMKSLGKNKCNVTEEACNTLVISVNNLIDRMTKWLQNEDGRKTLAYGNN